MGWLISDTHTCTCMHINMCCAVVWKCVLSQNTLDLGSGVCMCGGGGHLPVTAGKLPVTGCPELALLLGAQPTSAGSWCQAGTGSTACARPGGAVPSGLGRLAPLPSLPGREDEAPKWRTPQGKNKKHSSPPSLSWGSLKQDPVLGVPSNPVITRP